MASGYSTLSPEGPYVTGCLDLMSGRTRSGTLLRLFYPTDLKNLEGAHYTPWYLGQQYTEGMSQVAFPKLSSVYRWLWDWQSNTCVIPSAWEVPIAKGQFPLVIFSHGFAGQRSIYSIICNNLSSYGFVVACLEHRDGSAASTFTLSDTGEKVWHHCEKVPTGETEFNLRQKQVTARVEECTRAYELFHDLNGGKDVKNELPSTFDLSSLKNSLDMSKVVISGHSLGGATAVKCMMRTSFYQSCVALDPWMLPLKNELEEVSTNIKKPVFSILTENFLTPKNVEALKKIPEDLSSFILLKGSIHNGQSDAPYVLGLLGQILGLSSKLDRETTLNTNNALIVNFISTHLGLSSTVPSLDLDLLHRVGRFSLEFEDLSLEKVKSFLENKKIALKDTLGSKL